MIWNNMKFWPVSSRMISSPSKPRTWRLQLALICLGSADIAGSARWLPIGWCFGLVFPSNTCKICIVYIQLYTYYPLTKKTMGQLNAPFSKMRSFPKKHVFTHFYVLLKKSFYCCNFWSFQDFGSNSSIEPLLGSRSYLDILYLLVT